MKTTFKLLAISAVAMTLVACGGGGGGSVGPAGPQGAPGTPAPAPAPTPVAQPGVTFSEPSIARLQGVGPDTPASRLDGSVSGAGGQYTISNGNVSGYANGVAITGRMDETISFTTPAKASGTGLNSINIAINAGAQYHHATESEALTWKHIATGQNQGVEITAEDGKKILLPYAPNVQLSQTISGTEDGVTLNLQSTTVLNTTGNPYQVGYLNAAFGNGSNPIRIGNAVTTPLAISSSNADIQAAWNAGWRGQGVNVGFNSSNLTTVNNAFETMRTTVAPLIGSYNNSQFDVVVGLETSFIAAPGPHWSSLKANGLYVSSYANILTAKAANPTYTVSNVLAVTHLASVTNNSVVSYNVPTATSMADASIKGAGMAAIVMSKFNGLSGVQAGDVLQQTAVTNAGNGKTLSLQNALAPAGKLR